MDSFYYLLISFYSTIRLNRIGFLDIIDYPNHDKHHYYLVALKLYQNLLLRKIFYFILYLCTLEIAPYYFIYNWFKKIREKYVKFESENNISLQPEPKVENSYFELQK